MRNLLFLLIPVCCFAQQFELGMPFPVSNDASAPGCCTTFIINQTSDKVIYYFTMPAAATLTGMGFGYGTRTGTPVQHRISIQGINGSGVADGTLLAVGAFTPPADTTWNQTWRNIAITNDSSGGSISSLAVTKGQTIAVVIDPCPGATAPCSGAATPDGSNNGTFFTRATHFWSVSNNFPYTATIDGGAAQTRVTDLPVFSVCSATTCYGYPILTATFSANTNSGTTPDEIGVSFTVPCGTGSTYQIAGFRYFVSQPSAGHNIVAALYTGTTSLQSITIDNDFYGGVNTQIGAWYFTSSTLSTLTCGSTYRLAFAPSDSTNQQPFYYVSANDTTQMTAWDGGAAWVWTQRTDAGSWSDTTTRRPLIGLIIQNITAPTAVQTSFGFVK